MPAALSRIMRKLSPRSSAVVIVSSIRCGMVAPGRGGVKGSAARLPGVPNRPYRALAEINRGGAPRAIAAKP